MFDLTDSPIDTAALRRRLQSPGAGALAVFEGWVRNHHEGREVARLEYECEPNLCRAEADRILAEARRRFDLLDLAVVHRVGSLAIGDTAVWIGVASAHRDAAFAACRFLIEELKARLPVWKKEHYREQPARWIGME